MAKKLTTPTAEVTVSPLKNGMEKIEIAATDNAEIYVNGVLVWTKCGDPLLQYVPANMRPFVQEHKTDLGQDRSGDKTIYCDLEIMGERISMYFSPSGRKPITARFDLILPDLFEEEANCRFDAEDAEKLVQEMNGKWREMEQVIADQGYAFRLSHDMGEAYYGWWDVIFPSQDWDEAKFTACAEAIHCFNGWLGDFEKQNGLK